MSTSPTSHPSSAQGAATRQPASAEAAAAALASAAANSKAVASTVKIAPGSDKVAEALARIQASRARLRSALLPKRHAADDDGTPSERGSGFSLPTIAKTLWRNLRTQLRRSPSLHTALGAVHQWWKRQPWQDAVSLASGELHGVVAPVVRRHPWAAVGAAFAVGAAVVLARPWRWSIVNTQFHTLRDEALGTLRAQIFHVPLQMLLASLASLLVVQATTTEDGSDPAPGSSGGAGDSDPPPGVAF